MTLAQLSRLKQLLNEAETELREVEDKKVYPILDTLIEVQKTILADRSK